MDGVVGLQLSVSVPRFLLTRALGPVTGAAVYGGLSGLSRVTLPRQALPGPDWARLEIIATGICGTDLSTLAFKSAPSLEPFASFPAVLGHEILARVVEAGEKVEHVREGTRVAVDPVLSCTARGFDPDDICPSCAAGRPGNCRRMGEPGRLVIDGAPLKHGRLIGYHADLRGGWSTEILAHKSQLHPVHDGLGDREAVLIEPLSIGVHAVLGVLDHLGESVLVIGSGPIALGVLWAVRALGFDGHLVGQMKRGKETDIARRSGADEIVAPGAPAREALLATGAVAYEPRIGPEVFAGGFTTVFDCVGSRASIDQALRYSAPGGTVALLGCAGELRKLDLTPVWSDELSIRGFVCYGEERWEGRSVHTYEVTQALLEKTRPPLGEMVTAEYPLADYRRALKDLRDRGHSGAIKVTLGATSGFAQSAEKR